MDESAIAAVLANQYGIRVAKLEPVGGGFDPHASAFSVSDGQGRRFFVKVRSNQVPGIALATYLCEQGISEVVAPIRAIGGDIALPFEGGFLLVYLFVEGSNGFETPLSLKQWRRLGEAMRRIHDSELPRSILPKLGFEDFRRIEVDQIANLQNDVSVDAIGTRVMTTLSAFQMLIVAATSSFVSLGDELRGRELRFAPCHADLHVGNVLSLANDEIAIVDWDSPRFAPAECDLMFMRDGGILGRHGAEEEAAFFSGYGPVPKDAKLFEFYRLARTIEDIASFGIVAMDHHASEEARNEAYGWLKANLKDLNIPTE